MSARMSVGGVRYFDVIAVALAVVVSTGLLLDSVNRGSWTGGDVGKLAVFVAICAGFVAFRRHAYAQNVPWLIALFAASFGLALVIAWWPAPVMWSIMAMGAGSILLLIGLVASSKSIGEPVTRLEVFKLVSVLGAGVIMFAVVEGFLRLVPGIFSEEVQQRLSETPSNSGKAHPYIGHLHRPNRTIHLVGRDFDASHQVDDLGFRNDWPWPEQADIVAVGDSLTFGQGVQDDQAWPTLVAGSTHKQVINLGLVGAGAQQYLRLYETFGVKLRPKLVLVGIYAQNDFWDSGMFDLWLRAGDGDNYMVWRNFGRPLRFRVDVRHPGWTTKRLFRSKVYPVLRYSHFFNLVWALVDADKAGRTATKTLDFNDGSRLQLRPTDVANMTAGAQPDRPEFRLVLDALQRIHSLAAKQGARVLMVLQPGKEEVYLPMLGESIGDPTSALRQAFDAAGIDYLDLAPAFRQRAAAGERLFFEVDSHPNQAGYALTGELVASHIKQNARAYGLED